MAVVLRPSTMPVIGHAMFLPACLVVAVLVRRIKLALFVCMTGGGF